MKYAYPAIFTPEDDGFSVDFPDVPHCYTDGNSLAEALENAADVLCLRLYDIEEASEVIPTPTSIPEIKVPDGSFVSAVCCDTLDYRKFYDKKSVKKTDTFIKFVRPTYLNGCNIAVKVI